MTLSRAGACCAPVPSVRIDGVAAIPSLFAAATWVSVMPPLATLTPDTDVERVPPSGFTEIVLPDFWRPSPASVTAEFCVQVIGVVPTTTGAVFTQGNPDPPLTVPLVMKV